MTSPQAVRVGLHPALAPWAPEVKYVMRTLLTVAGYAPEFAWAAGDAPPFDIYYGPEAGAARALVAVPWCGRQFGLVGPEEPDTLLVDGGLPLPLFGEPLAPGGKAGSARVLPADLVYACYWMLIGARETAYPRIPRDNLDLTGSFVRREGLLERPLVSLWGAELRRVLSATGRAPALAEWDGGDAPTFVFTHDVDYPVMIRWIEVLRLLASRGPRALSSIGGVVRGTNHFWTFADWVAFEAELGARPAFYFMARQGSLLQYARGTPDDFYDVRTPRFRALLAELRAQGCEIGLHASYHAHRSAAQLKHEVEVLRDAAGCEILGNRHHYWHLDPDAPNETLRKHEHAGLRYDCSLGLEFYPGFRRGICHPFRVWHPGERRALDVVQLPTAWMDDHFDRRLAQNGCTDPDATGRTLLDVARATGGITLVDYHSRGMNADFYPRYGPWFKGFAQRHLGGARFRTPAEITEAYTAHAQQLAASERDLTVPERIVVQATPVRGDRITVEALTDARRGAWDQFVAAHPERTCYHSLGWRAVTEETFGHEACYRVALRAGEIVGVLPLFMVRGPFGRRLVSVPMRDRAGVLASDPAAVVPLLQDAMGVARDHHAAYLEVRTEHAMDPAVARELGLHVVSHWVTTRLDLTVGREAIWQGLDRKDRWAIRKAEKTAAVEPDDSPAGADRFYELFARTRHWMGIPPFSRQLFRSIQQHIIAAGMGKCVIVRSDGTDIGAMVAVFSGRTAFIPAYAAPQNEYRKLYPSEVAYWHTIGWAADQGFQSFDFGADSPDQSGLLFYKRKWGAVHRLMNYYFWLSPGTIPPDFDSEGPGYRLARDVWRRLPAPVSRGLGPWVARQLS